MKKVAVLSIIILIACSALCQGKTIYVQEGSGGAGTGWADAYGSFQDALDDAVYDDEIWVAEGMYYPDPNGLADPREACFQMINNVAIYGGFPIGGSDFGSRDPNQFETILSGDLLKDDNPATHVWNLPDDPTREDNCYNVFCHLDDLGLDPNAILDGFTVTGAYYYGMTNWSCSPTVSNCIFTMNSGMGMENFEDSDPSITNCTFTLNSFGGMGNSEYSDPSITNCTFISNFGAGMSNNMYSSPTVTDCTFSNNSGPIHHGVGMGNSWYSNPTVTNCIFIGNFQVSGGFGMENSWYSKPTVIGCEFYGSSSFYAIDNKHSDLKMINCTFVANGGVIYNEYSSAELIGCTLTDNEAFNGAIYNVHSEMTLANCIVWENIDGFGGQINLDYRSVLNVKNCNIRGGVSTIREIGDDNTINWNQGNIDADPMFVRYPDDGGDGWLDGLGAPPGSGLNNDPGDLRLMPQSPCIDVGTEDFKIPIVREGYPFGDGLITLDERNVDTTTIVVRNFLGSNIYTEGDDYDIVVVGDQVEIHVKVTGSVPPNITEGQPLYVDYEFYFNIVDHPTDPDGHSRVVDGDCDSTATVDMGAYEFDWVYLGDFAGGCDINLGDFAVLAGSWGEDNPAIDIAPYLDPDGVIDLNELLVLAEHWLEGIILSDLTKNGRVDYEDFAMLAGSWQEDDPELDIAPAGAPDGIIDLQELMMLANDWLDGSTP